MGAPEPWWDRDGLRLVHQGLFRLLLGIKQRPSWLYCEQPAFFFFFFFWQIYRLYYCQSNSVMISICPLVDLSQFGSQCQSYSSNRALWATHKWVSPKRSRLLCRVYRRNTVTALHGVFSWQAARPRLEAQYQISNSFDHCFWFDTPIMEGSFDSWVLVGSFNQS